MRQCLRICFINFNFSAVLLLCSLCHAAAAADNVTIFKTEFATVRVSKSASVEIRGCQAPIGDFTISKYEVTNTEYAAFLNSVARVADPFDLYNSMQEKHFWGGIIKTRVGATAEYSVKDGYENLPVTFVSWMDAVRYANWLHFGRPNTGKSELGTTEGTSIQGAYDTTKFMSEDKLPGRNTGAKYFLPNCGEWIYAGFFDPTRNKLSKYVGGDSLPKSGPPDSHDRSANYYAKNWALPFPHLAPVNSYTRNVSALGTYNQAGNAMEWVEANGNAMALGGSLFLPADTLTSEYRDSEIPSAKLSSFGFRVAGAVNGSGSQSQVFSARIARMPLETGVSEAPRTVVPRKWVRIENNGNLSDVFTGRGCVPYIYEIGNTEITNDEYAEFLNAIAKKEDSFSLYVTDMSSGVAGGLDRFRTSEGYFYAPKMGMGNRPVTYLSWFSLARYANWLHYGKPTGSQIVGTTEGDSGQGAYDTTRFEVYQRDNGGQRMSKGAFTRNSDAKYFIPSDDEWYKAAYFDPERPGWRKYWNYPGRSDAPPPNNRNGSSSANYQTETLGEGPPFFVSAVGQFGSRGYYEIYDLGGNVWEWLEDWRNLGGGSCWRCDIPTKALRGGSFNYIHVGLVNSNVDPGVPNDHYFVYGGRIARRVESSVIAWCTPSSVRYTAGSVLRKIVEHRYAMAVPFAVLLFCLIGITQWRRAKSKHLP